MGVFMRIRRKALLIGNSQVTPNLPGVEKDLRRYTSFLISNQGGAWEQDEITISLNEDHSTISYKCDLLRDADYSFVLIAGHGRHEITSNGDEETCIWIDEDTTVPVKKYFPRVAKGTILVDVCRNIVYLMEKAWGYDTLIKSLSREDGILLTRAEYRARFDQHVINCPENRIVMFSCGMNQSAGDNGDGGIFSNNMLRAISKDNRGDIIDMYSAFSFARDKTLEDNYPQQPVLHAGRTRDFFPFGLT
jgi:hypothetical protein